MGDGTNIYRYVWNNPINGIDKNGKFTAGGVVLITGAALLAAYLWRYNKRTKDAENLIGKRLKRREKCGKIFRKERYGCGYARRMRKNPVIRKMTGGALDGLPLRNEDKCRRKAGDNWNKCIEKVKEDFCNSDDE